MSMAETEFYEQLTAMRAYLAQCWSDWAQETGKSEAASGKNMCRFTSSFLVAVLGAPWRVAGGGCRYDDRSDDVVSVGGFYDGRAWQAHYWVTDGERIVDLTASQFGAEDVLVTSADDPRYDANYLPQECRAALNGVQARAGQWAADYALCLQAEALLEGD
jgi:hypothetical protein